MVHQLAAEVKQDNEDDAPQARGGYHGGSFGRSYGQIPRERGTFKKMEPDNEVVTDNRRPFRWKRGVRNKFKWFSANYIDWNNEGEQTTVSSDVEMVDVEHEIWAAMVNEHKEEPEAGKLTVKEAKADGGESVPEVETCRDDLEKRLTKEEKEQPVGIKNGELCVGNVREKITYSNAVNGKSPVAGVNENGSGCTPSTTEKVPDTRFHPNKTEKRRDKLSEAKASDPENGQDLGEIFILKNGKYVPVSKSSAKKSKHHNPSVSDLKKSTNKQRRPPLNDVTSKNSTDHGHPDNRTFRHGSLNPWQLRNNGQNDGQSRIPVNILSGPPRQAMPRFPIDVSVPPPNLNRILGPQARPPQTQNIPRYEQPPPPQLRHPASMDNRPCLRELETT
jgi:hypothetical protein